MCSVLRTDMQLAQAQECARLAQDKREGPNALFSAFVLCLVVMALTVGMLRGCTDRDPGDWTMGDGSQMEAR